MSDLSFGLIMTVFGMGVTLLTLLVLALVIRVMIRIYPFKEEEPKK